MSFTDCGEGKVWLEVGEPSHFRVSEAGVVDTLRHLSLAEQGEATVVVYARDLQSKQVWKTKVHLHAGPQQVTQETVSACLHWLTVGNFFLFDSAVLTDVSL